MLVPGSHKANIAIGDVPELRPSDRGSMDGVPGAVHMYMDPGDVLLFVDCCAGQTARPSRSCLSLARRRVGVII